MTYLQISHTLESNIEKMLPGWDPFLAGDAVGEEAQLASGALV